MTWQDTKSIFPELLDVQQLRKDCDALAAKGSGKLLEVRAALLPVLRQASNEGREKHDRSFRKTAVGSIAPNAFPGFRTG